MGKIYKHKQVLDITVFNGEIMDLKKINTTGTIERIPHNDSNAINVFLRQMMDTTPTAIRLVKTDPLKSDELRKIVLITDEGDLTINIRKEASVSIITLVDIRNKVEMGDPNVKKSRLARAKHDFQELIRNISNYFNYYKSDEFIPAFDFTYKLNFNGPITEITQNYTSTAKELKIATSDIEIEIVFKPDQDAKNISPIFSYTLTNLEDISDVIELTE